MTFGRGGLGGRPGPPEPRDEYDRREGDAERVVHRVDPRSSRPVPARIPVGCHRPGYRPRGPGNTRNRSLTDAPPGAMIHTPVPDDPRTLGRTTMSIRFPLLSLTLLALCGPALAAEARKPNVLVFLSDDVGYGEYGFQGSKDIPTPHIDSIARNGVRFTQGYVSGPYCSPTRAGLMTGRYQTRFGHEFNSVARRSRPAADRDDDRRPAEVARLRHLRDRQVAPRQRARVSPDPTRVRRVLRHAGQHAVLSPHPVRRLARLARRAGGRGRRLLHHRRLRRPRRRLAGEAQGHALLPLRAVQRPARPAAGAAEIPGPLPEHRRREPQAVRGDDVGHGRRRRPHPRQGPRAGAGGQHPDLLHLRQRRPDALDDLEERAAPRLQGDHLGGRRPRPDVLAVEGDDPRRHDLRAPDRSSSTSCRPPWPRPGGRSTRRGSSTAWTCCRT